MSWIQVTGGSQPGLVAAPPESCQLCAAPFSKKKKVFDARLATNPQRGWFCETCFATYGVGLGIGKGQAYAWLPGVGNLPKLELLKRCWLEERRLLKWIGRRLDALEKVRKVWRVRFEAAFNANHELLREIALLEGNVKKLKPSKRREPSAPRTSKADKELKALTAKLSPEQLTSLLAKIMEDVK